MKRVISFLLCLFIVLSSALVVTAESTSDTVSPQKETNANDYSKSDNSYAEYLKKNENAVIKEKADDIVLDNVVVISEKSKSALVDFTVTNTGWYSIKWKYRSIGFGSNDHQIGLKIDGKTLYDALAVIDVPRIWLAGETTMLADGSQVRASSKQDESKISFTFWDNSKSTEEPYKMLLEEGNHTLQFDWVDGNIEISEFTFFVFDSVPSYKEYVNNYSDYQGEPLAKIEGENYLRANSISVTAASDLSSSLTTPFDYGKQLINTIGGSNWRYSGQSIEWKIVTKEAGLYHLSIRFRQSYKENMKVYRRLLINNEVPYKEAFAISFDYKNSWQYKELETALYLNEGENTISLEATQGETSEVIAELSDSVQKLNTLYRKILMLTGPNPDTYRDYNIENEIPGIKEEIAGLSVQLAQIVNSAEKIFGSISAFAPVSNTQRQLESLNKNIRTLTQNGRLSRLKQNVSALASLSQTLQEQPLSIDSLQLSSPTSPARLKNEGFFDSIVHKVKRFVASFVNDYGAGIGTGDKGAVTIWTAIGRDQLQILKSMTDNQFSKEKNINVQIQLVTGSLIQAVLAGKGPDVVLGQTETNVINYAMRDALVDLSRFDDFDEIMTRFSKGAEIPYTYKDGVYAIPQTQSFEMMFVRTDILDELGLNIPKTWTDFITKIFPVLQRENLLVGLGNLNNSAALTSIYTTLLHQYGGNYFDDDGLKTAFDSPESLDAFDFAVSLYREYGVPTEYDFLNRFRTGEMPIALANYSSYNTLQVGAPEIAGLWTMVQIPGVLRDDGTINNTQLLVSNGTIMLAGAKNKNASWEFIKWWTSADTQRNFGLQQEAILGPSGRYTPANIEAMAGLSWSSEQLKRLEDQRAVSTPLRHIPGSYYIGKSINSALVTSVNNSDLIPREELMYWADMINDEMQRKQKEFNYTGFTNKESGE